MNTAKLITSLVTILQKKKKVLDVQKVFVTILNKYGVELAILKRPYRGLTQSAVCKPVCTSVSESYPAEVFNIFATS